MYRASNLSLDSRYKRKRLALRRVERWLVWSKTHGLTLWNPSTQFLIAHGVFEDEHCSKELLEWARRHLRLAPFAR